ncbi:MurR/RpiR family transcriptional regulator [Weissella viridescens]|uniref:MurR/RpiR family transcriptional regulator n=1 Tax=Weissella viridescens TaxID=1629 RepID=UPI001D072A8F|nr:MurR/RpiR family transcriptional regulator [Weissella viridescens]MCB6841014.1 MurR/RpiR family transcriptional regulator [Weissella viridescens]MCB6847753.1 MurR/RpiR family transcriptional regulator [Weissella viridescens]
MQQSGFARIKSLRDQLSGSDKNIADYILDHANSVQGLTIKGLADAVNVSTATISRFVKRIGFSSFREFSLSLTAVMQPDNAFFGEIENNDDTNAIVNKVFKGGENALSSTFNLIPTESWDTACAWIINARKLGFFGIGGSSIVALDGYHKFLRTPIDAEQHPDYDVQLMQAVRMRDTDVAIVVSHSGRNLDTLKITRQLKANNVKVIAITAYVNSTLAKLADLVLPSSAEEINIRSESMSSLLAQLAIIDSLFTLVGVHLGPDTLEIVDSIRQAIDHTRE